jgi:pimeloyl-ACP methyl ester carboxylesterase
MPGEISKLVLLAPDGLKVNFWYWLATQTYLGNRLFAFTMKNPIWYFKLLNAFYSLGFVNNSIYKFVKAYIDDEQVRNELYSRWTSFRKIKPTIPKIKQQITDYKTDVLFIYGRHDRIIRYERAERFIKGIENHCDLNIINAGHRVLNKKHAGEILAALLR